MKKYFEIGQTLKLSDSKNDYTITDIVGTGSSCVVYRAECSDGTEHLLKEYNPKYLELARDCNGNLFVDSEEDEETFEDGLKRFRAGYRKQLDIRKCIDLKNVTSNIQGIYSAYGTDYIDMSFFNGVTFDKAEPRSLFELVKYIRTITRIVGNYHDKGFLHLDIKPENIFTIPETAELVMLFDFDSVTEKSSVSTSPVLSYTKSWAAPEQIIPGKSKFICEATDIFAIGEMLFYFIYNRHSLPEERRSFYEYTFDTNEKLFFDIDERSFDLLSKIFQKTITARVSKRFQTTKEFLDVLDELSGLTAPQTSKLISKLPHNFEKAFGRRLFNEEDYCFIDNLLEKEQIINLNAKKDSRLALEYIFARRKKYNKIIHLVYNDDFAGTIANDNELRISHFSKLDNETLEEYVERKLLFLSEIVNKNDLFAIFNISDLNDSLLLFFKKLKCKCIFITDNCVEDEKSIDDVGTLIFHNEIINIIKTTILPCCKESDHYKFFFKGQNIPSDLIILANEYNISLNEEEVIFYAHSSKFYSYFILITDKCWYSGNTPHQKDIIKFNDYLCIKLFKLEPHKINVSGIDCGVLIVPPLLNAGIALDNILNYYHKTYMPKQEYNIHAETKEEKLESFVIDTAKKHFVHSTTDQSRFFTRKTGFPKKIFNAISTFAPGVNVEDIIVFLDQSITDSGKSGLLITKNAYYYAVSSLFKCSFDFDDVHEVRNDGIRYKYYYSNNRKTNPFYPANYECVHAVNEILKKYQQLLPSETDCFIDKNFSPVFFINQTQKTVQYINQSGSEVIFNINNKLLHQSIESKEDIFLKTIKNSILKHIVSDKPQFYSYYQKGDSFPPSLNNAILKFAPNVSPDDVVVFIDTSFKNSGKYSYIFTLEGYYCKDANFKYSELSKFIIDKSIHRYIKKNGEKHYFYPINNPEGFYAFVEILEKYQELFE